MTKTAYELFIKLLLEEKIILGAHIIHILIKSSDMPPIPPLVIQLPYKVLAFQHQMETDYGKTKGTKLKRLKSKD